MTTQTNLEAINAKLIADQAQVKADQAEVARLQAELAAMPVELQGKTDAEIAALGAVVLNYFGGTLPS